MLHHYGGGGYGYVQAQIWMGRSKSWEVEALTGMGRLVEAQAIHGWLKVQLRGWIAKGMSGSRL